MEAFSITGFSLGTMGFVLAVNALSQVDELEKHLKELGVLEEGYKAK